MMFLISMAKLKMDAAGSWLSSLIISVTRTMNIVKVADLTTEGCAYVHV